MLQIQGYDSLRAKADSVMKELQWVYDVYADAAEFADASLELLREIPQEMNILDVTTAFVYITYSMLSIPNPCYNTMI